MVYDSNEALSSLTPKIQKLLPNSLKGETSLAVFRKKKSRCGQQTNACANFMRNI